MSSFSTPDHLLYTSTHEWIHLADDFATIGISDFAQDQLSDVVWVELPTIGENFDAGTALATVESVKAAADIYAPFTGVIVAINEDLVDSPEAINQDPYSSWFVKLKVDSENAASDFLSAGEYEDLISG